jgi:two-component system, OmpR family, sensor histidine kinase KdpD
VNRRLPLAVVTSIGAVALVTGAVYALKPVAPVLSLGVLYLFAVLFAAAVWGLWFGIAVSVGSMLVFNWFFLPPAHTFHLRESENWVALAVYLVTAVSVSGLAARARRRAAEAEQQRREAAYAAEISALLLERAQVEPQLAEIAVRTADLLGTTHCWIELGHAREPAPDETAYALDHGLGSLYVGSGDHPDPALTRRVLAVLSSLLATAIEREQLARADTAKTAVLRSVSHDLRSPITAIGTASEMLSEPLSDADREELLASIREQARRLDRLVANLLDLSRLEAGAATPLLELWTVDGLVARALEAIGPDSARVDVSLPADAPPVRVDAAQLERVLVNLLENALRHSSPGDPVQISAQTAGRELVVRVVDRGPGIAPGEEATIFQPFVQGAGGSARGSGLGLAIARGFAELNGGRLWVEPGPGARFALALPAVEIPVSV